MEKDPQKGDEQRKQTQSIQEKKSDLTKMRDLGALKNYGCHASKHQT